MRRPIALAVLIVALAAAAAWQVSRIVPRAPPPRFVTPPVEPPPSGGAPPPEAVDPAELDRLAARAEARDRYAALRDAFVAGRPSSPSKIRLEPVVAALWPAPAHADVTCRGLVCRVQPSPAPPGWQAALVAHEEVKALAERVAIDPDASTTPAYVLLAPKVADPAPPPRGEEFLRTIETMVRASPEVSACLAGAEPGKELELHLTLDGSGLTYRMGAGLGPQPSLCASMALASIMSTPPPSGVTGGERTFKMERPDRPAEAPREAPGAGEAHPAGVAEPHPPGAAEPAPPGSVEPDPATKGSE